MNINLSDIHAEVLAEFTRYETALVTNDVAALDAFFLPSETAIRYGISENLYGFEAISNFRANRSAVNLARSLEGTQITTYGTDLGIAATLFRRPTTLGKIGRQMQVWVRTPDGWRIAAAHVSVIDDTGA